jgi:EAL domain-containing protein (putative c-di-GMP-specific phosphodiesterase class I)
VRLFHPHKGLMSPASLLKNAGERALLALAEESLIETARVSSKLSELGLNPTIATNLTSRTLLGLQVPTLAREFAAKAKRPPNWAFDIDEDDLARNDAMVRTIDGKLRSLGIKLAIDNFTGRSLSRSALRGLPISELKLSSAVVARCASDPEDAQCKKLIDLAHSSCSVAVAMGVETASQSSALQQMGCDVGQGFFFGQPLPLEQIVAMIEQRSVIGDGKTYAERKQAREAEEFGTSSDSLRH